MLRDTIKEAKKETPDSIVSERGCCKYCGQTNLFDAPIGWPDEICDEAATEYCGCPEAMHYTQKKQKKENANEAIDKKFGTKSDIKISEQARQLLEEMAENIIENKIKKATVQISEELKAQIGKNKGGDIEIKRTVTKVTEETV